jgi:hypothetical protein
VDLSPHKPTIIERKHLKPVALSGLAHVGAKLLMDVNKTGQLQDSFAWA